jgi:hypothetical protein
MAKDTDALVETGGRFASSRLLQAAETLTGRIDDYEEFARFKIDDGWKRSVGQRVAAVEKALAARGAAATDVLPTGEALDTAVVVAKSWRRDLLTHADLAELSPAARKAFSQKATGTSIPGLIRGLTALTAAARTQAKALRAEGATPAFLAQGDTLLGALKTAYQAHRKTLRALSPVARTLQQRKGELYQLLKKATRVAVRLHLGKPGYFSVSALGRAPHRAPAKTKDSTGNAGGTGTPQPQVA